MIVRISLKATNGQEYRVRFDLSLGKDMKPLANMAYFGFYGSFRNTEVSSAILLNADGTIDMGYGFETSGRFHRTNLLSKTVALNNYVTIWWKWEAEPEETTYLVEAVTVLSAITEDVKFEKVTKVNVETLLGLPTFRGRVIRSFDIVGYDDVVYCPPIGVEGDLAVFQGNLIFCPDNAVSKNGMLLTEIVDIGDVELMDNTFDISLLTLLKEV